MAIKVSGVGGANTREEQEIILFYYFKKRIEFVLVWNETPFLMQHK
ncbi:hypothetical protein L2D08_14465 [Domibacillus sp. PGB-M46]|nr:hypothetical protein [Domibacillus sp. PGB-M46]MCI2255573.1 hypothetical protein [Domibacillus sp. PGB-M46]